ncbi:hypothetical protein IV203_014431 [Nitzschia inconspicua]|uniref:Glycosyltransferase family 92 protein n=1 Tax=Nitzschia inconspicua TaxID=303405 RepID=A0A9K3L8Q1_9STRA|nr:hypothetical protein IV203_014431 [Nitzschia inconspicua]
MMNQQGDPEGLLQTLYQRFFEQPELLCNALSYLDVYSLLQMKTVATQWEKVCLSAIDQKVGKDGPKPFQTKEELEATMIKYFEYSAKNMEEIAQTYGYPIGRVSAAAAATFLLPIFLCVAIVYFVLQLIVWNVILLQSTKSTFQQSPLSFLGWTSTSRTTSRTRTTVPFLDVKPSPSQQEQHQQEEEPQNSLLNESFSACLLTMEDDAIGLLHEWLAYHYTKLPLRRLIVANDPRSRTVPHSVLERWHDKITISEWTDHDYFPVSYRRAILNKNYHKNQSSTFDPWTTLHRFRQRFFFFKCLRQLKREGRTWVALIDSDEFLQSPNPRWRYLPNIMATTTTKTTTTKTMMAQDNHDVTKKDNHSMILVWSSWTVMDFLHRLHNHPPTTQPCISVPRLLFGTKPLDTTTTTTTTVLQQQQHRLVDKTLDSISMSRKDFVTLQWQWHGRIDDTTLNRAGKAIVDVSQIPFSVMDLNRTDIHRPVMDYCSAESVWNTNTESFLILHHYIGSWEQWSFRSDPRQTRTKERYDKYKTLDVEHDDSITSWLDEFVQQVGIETAKVLLEGTGRVQNIQQDSSKGGGRRANTSSSSSSSSSGELFLLSNTDIYPGLRMIQRTPPSNITTTTRTTTSTANNVTIIL